MKNAKSFEFFYSVAALRVDTYLPFVPQLNIE